MSQFKYIFLVIFFPIFANSTIDSKRDYSNVPTTTHSTGALASEPDNIQKFENNGSGVALVAVDIPDETSLKYSYPNLKFINDSSEIHDEGAKIASNSTMISGVASKYRERSRSLRSPYPTSWQTSRNGFYGGPYIERHRYNYNRYDGSPSSSWGGNWFNQLKRRTGMIMNPMMSSYDKQQQMMNQGTAEEPEMSGTFLSGWGQSGSYGKGVNKSAVGLLGFLSLLSLIQNVLNQTSPNAGRRKRDLGEVKFNVLGEVQENPIDWDETEFETLLIVPLILPMLNSVNDAIQGVTPVECTYRSICIANQILVERLGDKGKMFGKLFSESISKSMKRTSFKWKISESGSVPRVMWAAQLGRRGKDCYLKFDKFEEDHRCQKRTMQSPIYDIDTVSKMLRYGL